MSNIMDLVAEYVSVRTLRQKKEKEAEEIKNGKEADLKARILAEMSAQGIKSANLEGVGRVVRKTTYHYEIQDMERLAEQMFRAMLISKQSGRLFSDGFLLQKRISKEQLEAYMENSIAACANTPLEGGKSVEEMVAEMFGVKNVEKQDLSFTKA